MWQHPSKGIIVEKPATKRKNMLATNTHRDTRCMPTTWFHESRIHQLSRAVKTRILPLDAQATQ